MVWIIAAIGVLAALLPQLRSAEEDDDFVRSTEWTRLGRAAGVTTAGPPARR